MCLTCQNHVVHHKRCIYCHVSLGPGHVQLSIHYQQLTLYSCQAFVDCHLCHVFVTLFILSCHLHLGIALDCPSLLSFAPYLLSLSFVLDRLHLTYQGLPICDFMLWWHHHDTYTKIIIGTVTAYLSMLSTRNWHLEPSLFQWYFVFDSKGQSRLSLRQSLSVSLTFFYLFFILSKLLVFRVDNMSIYQITRLL